MTDSCQGTSNIRHTASQKSFNVKFSETHILVTKGQILLKMKPMF